MLYHLIFLFKLVIKVSSWVILDHTLLFVIIFNFLFAYEIIVIHAWVCFSVVSFSKDNIIILKGLLQASVLNQFVKWGILLRWKHIKVEIITWIIYSSSYSIKLVLLTINQGSCFFHLKISDWDRIIEISFFNSFCFFLFSGCLLLFSNKLQVFFLLYQSLKEFRYVHIGPLDLLLPLDFFITFAIDSWNTILHTFNIKLNDIKKSKKLKMNLIKH